MVILGIDYGDKRIGIAKSDSMGFLASGLDTIEWKNDISQPIEKIYQLTQQYKAERIVIGMPRNMDGSYGDRTKKTKEFAQKLQEKINNIDIVFWDERLTSKAAHKTMHARGMKTGHKKSDVDRIAACYILQSYLDSI